MGNSPILAFLCLVLCSYCPLILCQPSPTDRLAHGQFIKDGETLVSPNGTFVLGFFSPGSSGNRRYVAIWYHGVTPLTTVWVANRDRPLNTSSGSFGVSATDGNLVILDGNRTGVVWSANSSHKSTNSCACLLDTGNLILQLDAGASADSSSVGWQSFDHPTDTFLPGMKITAVQGQFFRSWRSADDPGTGNFSIGLDPRGSAQIYMWDGSSPRWRSGQWNGQMFLGTRMRSLYLFGFKMNTDNGGKTRYFTFSTFNTSLYRFALQHDGVENVTILMSKTRRWREIWSEPIADCELYNHCGANAVCNDQSGMASCDCLAGYVTGPEGRGCVRRSRWKCEGGGEGTDTFVKVGGLKLPDLVEWASTTTDEASCRDLCAGNCSCRAYAYSGAMGCLVWTTDLVDVHQSYWSNTNDLYLKLAASDAVSGKGSNSWIIAISVSLACGLFVLLLVCFFLWKCRAKVQGIAERTQIQKMPSVSVSDLDMQSHDFSSISDIGYSTNNSDLTLYTFECIAAATNYFSLSNKLGHGGFGDVYKGTFSCGQEIAVKRLSRSSGQGLEEFKNEAILIAKLQHRNLVRVLGYCIEKDEKILVYEYMPNKSLDAFIFDDSKKALLDWSRRFNIIDGIARGILYLHRDSRLRIIHRDLKASNILLDENMKPKISDFGMAKIFGNDQNQDNTNRVVGTFGYMSPEYAMTGLFSEKLDVYSFGVLMLEIISGRKNIALSKQEHGKNLVGYAWKLWNEDRALELVDAAMGQLMKSDQVLRCIHIGLLCVQDKVVDRPLMSSVLLMLGSKEAILIEPKQPTYTLEGATTSSDFIQLEEIFTSSDITMTGVDVR